MNWKNTLAPLAWTAALAIGSAALPAMAQTGGTGLAGRTYVGIGAGKPKWDSDNVAGVVGGGSSGTAYNAYLGYGVTDNLAVELGGAHLGHLNSSTGDAKADAVYLDAVGTWPMTQEWSVLGRLGVANSKLTAPAGSERGNGLHGGLGVQYNINRNVGVRGEWQRFHLNALGASPNVDTYTIGVNYAF